MPLVIQVAVSVKSEHNVYLKQGSIYYTENQFYDKCQVRKRSLLHDCDIGYHILHTIDYYELLKVRMQDAHPHHYN